MGGRSDGLSVDSTGCVMASVDVDAEAAGASWSADEEGRAAMV